MGILQHLTSHNSDPCLVSTGEVLSYAEVQSRSHEIREKLGTERCLVALEACASPNFVIAYVALLEAGFPFALLPPGHRDAAEQFHRDFQPGITIYAENGGWEIRHNSVKSAATPHSDLALMLATSGSEGRPRWVRLSRANLEANASSIVEYLELTASDRVARILPFHYSYGLSVLNTHLFAGGSLAFCGDSVVEAGFLRRVARLGCTGVSGVPYSYELLERLSFRGVLWPELRYMTVAGGRLPPDLVRQYEAALRMKGGRFFVMYGQTEATARMAYIPHDLVRENSDCIGVAIPGGKFKLVDERGRIIREPCGKGELVYAGPNVMMGYATRCEDLARGSETVELSTGDIASITLSGLYKLEGRASRFSKILGIRVGHEAIEWRLRTEGLVCAVTGTDDAITLHLEGMAEAGLASTVAELAGIPARCVDIRTHDLLPRLTSGKIDYKQLAAAARQQSVRNARSLREEFGAAFYPKQVTPRDSFESLEGDSLAYVQASMTVEQHLGFLPDAWETLTIEQLDGIRPVTPVPMPSSTSRIESHLVLRAAAILLVVVHHATLWPVPGGAAALMLMVGYGFARFHGPQLLAGATGTFLLPLLRNLLPYFVIVAGFTIAWQQVPWASVLLLGNLGFADPVRHEMLPFQFWFVEAYAQLCFFTAAAFSVPAVRAAVARRPFAVALGLVFLVFALRYALPPIYDIGNRKIFTLTYVLWLPMLGWCAYHAKSKVQKTGLLCVAAVLCAIAAYTAGNWQGAWILYMLQLAVLSILLLLPHLHLPRIIIPAILLISAASYHIYLFHRIVPELMGLDALGSLGPAASILLGVISGIGALSLQKRIFGVLKGRRATKARLA